MVKHVGVKLSEDLYELLLQEKTVGVLATFSEKGLPHTTPIQWMYPVSLESVLITIQKDHEGYHNMVWQKKVMMCFLDGNNIAYSMLGRAGVVRAPSSVHPLMNIVRIDVIEINSNKSSVVQVDAGVKWHYISPEAEELGAALMNELKELARTL